MLKLKLILPFVLFFSVLYGQDSFKTVDSTTYQLYLKKNWKDLSKYGKKASKQGYDYYYLNVRTGIAYFELESYKKAKKFFEKSLINNSSSLFVKEYLFWSNINLLREPEAYDIYKTLSDTVKKSINYTPKKSAEYLMIESGMKVSNNKNAAGNLYYANVGLNSKWLPYFSTFQSYSFMQQKTVWGNMHQHQVVFSPQLNLKKGWKITGVFNYSNYTSYLNFGESYSYNTYGHIIADSGEYRTDTTNVDKYLFSGNYNQNGLLTQLNISKQIGGLSLTPHVSYYAEWASPDYKESIYSKKDIKKVKIIFPMPPATFTTLYDTTITDYNSTSYNSQWQVGLDLNYSIRNKVTIGGDLNMIRINQYKTINLVPYIKIKMSDNFSLFAYRAVKNNYTLSLFGGKQFINTYDNISSKTSFTGEFRLSDKTNLYTTYQIENVGDILSLKQYKFNSLFAGLKIKL